MHFPTFLQESNCELQQIPNISVFALWHISVPFSDKRFWAQRNGHLSNTRGFAWWFRWPNRHVLNSRVVWNTFSRVSEGSHGVFMIFTSEISQLWIPNHLGIKTPIGSELCVRNYVLQPWRNSESFMSKWKIRCSGWFVATERLGNSCGMLKWAWADVNATQPSRGFEIRKSYHS